MRSLDRKNCETQEIGYEIFLLENHRLAGEHGLPSSTGVAEPFPVPPPLPKRSGTCPLRCPFLYRSIAKRPAMAGSGLGRYVRAGQPPVSGGDGARAGIFSGQPGQLIPIFRKVLRENCTEKRFRK